MYSAGWRGQARRAIGERMDGCELIVAEVARASVAVDEDARALVWTIDARLMGDAAPVEGPPREVDGLWQHEVVELFVVGAPFDRTATYVELEVAPSGHWLALRLEGYRQRVARGLPVDVEVEIDDAARTWRAVVRLSLDELPPRPWRVNMCAVHGPAEARRYWSATTLGGDRPDFHRVWDFTSEVASSGA